MILDFKKWLNKWEDRILINKGSKEKSIALMRKNNPIIIFTFLSMLLAFILLSLAYIVSPKKTNVENVVCGGSD